MDEVEFVPYETEEGEDVGIQQDAYIYVGLPIMATKNKKGDDDEMIFVNNERFTITAMADGIFTAVAERPDGEWSIQVSVQDFHSMFILGYASTTHKSQGATIDNDIVIFNYDKMSKNLKYTAITRAKKLSQLIIVL